MNRESASLMSVCVIFFASFIITFQVNAAPILPSVDETLTLDGPNNLWVEIYNYTNIFDHVDISRTETGYIISGSYQNTSSLDLNQGIIIIVSMNGTVLFQKSLGGVNEDELYSAIQCNNGDFVIVGNTWSFGANETGGLLPRLWLARLSINGSVLWNRWYDNLYWGNSISECQDGSFIIAAGTPHLVLVGENGSLLWSKSYHDWDFSKANTVVECEDGGFAFAGMADTDPTSEIDYRAWLVRTDPNGTMLWNQTFDGVVKIGSSLIQCSDGGFAIAGESGDRLYSPWFPWLVRTDESGNLLWDKTYSKGNVFGGATSLVECPNAGFGITGVAAESADHLTWDALFVRTDDEGDELWRSTCSGPYMDYGISLVLSHDGGFAVAGLTDQDDSWATFLWLLSDEYVTPTPTTVADTELLGIILAGSAITGIFIAAVIILNLRRHSH